MGDPAGNWAGSVSLPIAPTLYWFVACPGGLQELVTLLGGAGRGEVS